MQKVYLYPQNHCIYEVSCRGRRFWSMCVLVAACNVVSTDFFFLFSTFSLFICFFTYKCFFYCFFEVGQKHELDLQDRSYPTHCLRVKCGKLCYQKTDQPINAACITLVRLFVYLFLILFSLIFPFFSFSSVSFTVWGQCWNCDCWY